MSAKKACRQCQKELPLTSEHFYRDRTVNSGFKSVCRECMKADARERKRQIRATPEGLADENWRVFRWRLRNRPGFLALHATERATKWLAEAHPDEFARLLADATAELEAEAVS